MTSVYTYWQKSQNKTQTTDMLLPTLYPAVEGQQVSQENPQPGLWKVYISGGYVDGVKQPKVFGLMQLWLCEAGDRERNAVHVWREGLSLVGDIDDEPASEAQIASRWNGAECVTKKTKDFYFANGKRWPEDPPPPVSAASDKLDAQGPRAAVPGDNSNDLETFAGMQAQITGEAQDAAREFKKNPVDNKVRADMAENWRARISKLIKKADDLKKIEKKPHLDAAAAIEEKWKELIAIGSEAVISLKSMVDVFDAAERKRLKDEAEKAAREKWERDQEERRKEREQKEEERKAAEEANAKILADRAEMERNDPIAALTGSLPEFVEVPDVAPVEPAPEFVAPVVDIPKTLYGTGTEGNRRSSRDAPATATITDLKAAAIYYAEQQHPDLIKLIQKLADKAAKARATVPGVSMSKAA